MLNNSILLHLLRFMLHHLTSTFAPVIDITTTRGLHLTINVNMVRNNPPAQTELKESSFKNVYLEFLQFVSAHSKLFKVASSKDTAAPVLRFCICLPTMYAGNKCRMM